MVVIGWIMGINPELSRRTYHIRALWYKKDTDTQDILNKEAIPEARFYVKEISPFVESQNDVANVMRLGSSSTTLETPDIIDGMTQNDFVMYRGSLYIVESVSSEDKNHQLGFKNRPSVISRIGIRR
jgi:hypothetical protein